MKKRYITLLIVLLLSIIILIFYGYKTYQHNQELQFLSLKSLPYLQYSEQETDITKMGVVTIDPKRSYLGYNLIGNVILDMDGNKIKILPNGFLYNIGKDYFIMAKEIEEGTTNGTLIKYDKNLNIIWEKKLMWHHEIEIAPDDSIYVLTSEVHIYNGRNVIFDNILQLSKDGEEIRKWSTFDHLDEIKKVHEISVLDFPPGKDINESLIIKEEDGSYEYYHLNSIKLLPKTPLSNLGKTFQEGNIMISIQRKNLVLILDKDTLKIVWSYGPKDIIRQHTPTMIDNGNILIFDNGNEKRSYSRVIEVNPITKKIVWEYAPEEPFFSYMMGSAQRLPNGNTLIADGTNGRAFEVTKDKKIVWEWYNPDINEDNKRKIIYRATRLEKFKIDKFFKL